MQLRTDIDPNPTPTELQRELDELDARFDSEENRLTGTLKVDRYYEQRSVITKQLKAAEAAHQSAGMRAAPPARAAQQAIPDAPEMAPERKAQFEALRTKFKQAHEKDDLEAMVSICADESYAQLREENAEIAAQRMVRNLFRKSPGAGARLGLETIIGSFIKEQHHVRLELAVHLTQLKKLLDRIKTLEERPELKYVGVHQEDKQYAPGNVCTWDGSMWYCHAPTRERPGSSATWQLCVKHGDRAKDLYQIARDELGFRGTKQEWLESIGVKKK